MVPKEEMALKDSQVHKVKEGKRALLEDRVLQEKREKWVILVSLV